MKVTTSCRWICAWLSCWVLGLAGAEFPYTGMVTGNRVYVRCGPGTAHATIGLAYKGERLQVLGRKGAWFEVRMPEGCRMWVAAKYLEKPEEGKPSRVTADRVNLRAEGNDRGEAAGQAMKGDRVLVWKLEGDWVQVTPPLEGLVAYISSEFVAPFVEEEKPKPPTAVPVAPVAQAKPSEPMEVSAKRADAANGEPVNAAANGKPAAAPKPPEESVRAGWLYERGPSQECAPGTHVLVQGGQVVCRIQVERESAVDLSAFRGKLVQVRGTEREGTARSAPVIVLRSPEQIQLLPDREDEESSPGGPGR